MSGKPPDASLPLFFGTGRYRRTLAVPADWNGRQITLDVGRVVMEAWVHVNGRPLHHHAGYSTTWKADIGSHLRTGEMNGIVIAVDSARAGRHALRAKSRSRVERTYSLLGQNQRPSL